MQAEHETDNIKAEAATEFYTVPKTLPLQGAVTPRS